MRKKSKKHRGLAVYFYARLEVKDGVSNAVAAPEGIKGALVSARNQSILAVRAEQT